MPEGERKLLAVNFNREEWGTILDADFGKSEKMICDYLIGLRTNGNRPLPFPATVNETYFFTSINTAIKRKGFELVAAKPDPYQKGPQHKTYQLVRVKK